MVLVSVEVVVPFVNDLLDTTTQRHEKRPFGYRAAAMAVAARSFTHCRAMVRVGCFSLFPSVRVAQQAARMTVSRYNPLCGNPANAARTEQQEGGCTRYLITCYGLCGTHVGFLGEQVLFSRRYLGGWSVYPVCGWKVQSALPRRTCLTRECNNRCNGSNGEGCCGWTGPVRV